MSALVTAVFEFDGRDRGALERAVEQPLSDDELRFIQDICAQNDGRQGRAAMWVVRTLLEKKRGERLNLAQVFKNLPTDYEWVTRFHLLQSVRYAPALAAPYVEHVRALLDHQRTALRVVALDAFVHIATVDDRWMPEAKARLLQAAEDEMASMRSRAKFLFKMLAG